jgi:phosphate starvation-inducible PhoH-like protein
MKKEPKKVSGDIFSKLEPLNKHQEDLIQHIKTQDMVIVDGVAGTGKTFITASCAALMLKAKLFERIIITRPVVPTGRSLGYFPGELLEKMRPWVIPFMEVIKSHFTKEEIEVKLLNGSIEVVPFEVMRGRSFDDSFVILDEAQNTSTHEIKMFLTRTGMFSRTIVLGDSRQSDMHWLQPHEESGLQLAKRLAKNVVGVPVVEFEAADVVRSDLCKKWIEAFDTENRLPDFIAGRQDRDA